MASGALMTMPVLIVNMGGEMVYILSQRLQAQKIPETKGQKVLCDVVRTMYYPRFIEELFKPQDMYSIQSTRQIFDRLAHSSIMRLNESSMDKLFDLMIMGFKFQLISCASPRDLIDITQNHLDALRRLAGDGEGLSGLVDECVRQVQAAYGSMSAANLCAMRQSLCCFVQDRKVKVSLFLHDNSQKSDGSFVVPSTGTLPSNALPTGTVRYFSGSTEVNRESLPTASSTSFQPSAAGGKTQLGFNIYEKDRSATPGGSTAAANSTPAPPPPPPPPAAAVPDESRAKAAVGELNTLAALIGTSHTESTDNFKLESLFGADIFAKDTGGGRSAEIIEIDGSAPSQHRASLDSLREQMEVPAAPDSGAPDDLLDLMDQAQ
eukprot:TRINITY_DN12106_c0_g1_i1.p1 TRINITY_DN12106_c0_g1~~TRINITY_DN12106_c0_g1_i1.p1  ORF type:complete len:378 (-),score=80.09 TRINITY_DN12106_c0_g1_i1:98-1231(-)